MSFLNRTLNYFSSRKTSTKRKIFRAFSENGDSVYLSGDWLSRTLRNWMPSLKSGKTELSTGQRELTIARAYDAYRNQSLARAVIKRIKEGAVGVGLELCPTIEGELLGLTDEETIKLEDVIEREFDRWKKNCDLERTLSLSQFQALAITNMLITGDCFINTVYKKYSNEIYSLKFQMVDTSRVCNSGFSGDTKKNYSGIEVDEFGSPVSYTIRKAHRNLFFSERSKSLECKKYPVFGEKTGRRRFFHIFDKDIPEQLRGISVLAPIIADLKQLSRYSDAELMATVLTSYMTVILENETLDEDYSWKGKSEKDNYMGGKDLGLGHGAILELPKGRKVSQITPTRPNQGFDSFMLAVMRNLSAGTGIPLDELLLKFDRSYSSARASMLKAYNVYRIYRKILIDMWLDEAYGLFFDELVVTNSLPFINNYSDFRRRELYHGHVWIGQGRGAIDEVDEVNAAGARVKNGFSSLPLETAELKGVSLRTVQRQQARALRRAKMLGIQYNVADTVTVESNLKRKKEIKEEEDAN